MSTAQIVYQDGENKVTLDYLSQHLRSRLPYAVIPAEWHGFGSVIQQLRVETNPPLAIQINDSADYVPEENLELADLAEHDRVLPPESIAVIRKCRTRLEITTCQPTDIRETGSRGILTSTPTDVDPSLPEIREVILFLSTLLGGFAHDDLNGGWIEPL